jgi:hypothetical protein
MNHFFSNNFRRRILFFLLPAFYVFLSFVILKNATRFYMNGPDPVYAYLMNATNLAGGHLEIGHFDHPGTPVQCLGAAVIFTQYMISGTLPLYQDVLSNPESYLYTCSLVLILLIGGITYLTARYVYRHTGNMYMAILFQLSPLLSTGMLNHAILFKPEALIIIVNTFFTAWLFVTAVQVNRSGNPLWNKKSIALAAIFSALLVACKITCLPLILLIYFLVRNNRQRILFTGAFSVSFLFFILPALSKFHEIYDWIKRLVSHDGHYGQGKEQFVNVSEFKHNLHTIFTTDTTFKLTYLFITLAFLVCLIKFFLRKSPDRFQFRFISGLWVSINLLILLVAKHYSFHYLIPAQTFFPLAILVAYMVFSPFLDLGLYSRNTRAVKSVFALGVLLILAKSSISASFLFPDHRSPMIATEQYLNTWKNTPIIITADNESSRVETSLYFGTVYTGTLNHQYFQFLKTLYPNSYLYQIGSKRFLFWDVEVFLPEMLKKQSKVIVYFKNQDPASEEASMQDLTLLNGKVKLAEYRKIFGNTSTNESVYLIEADTALSAKIASGSNTIFCDLEKRTEDNSQFISEDGQARFLKAEELNHELAYSGNTSVKLDTKTQYGLDCIFPVQSGDFVDITIWRKSTDNSGTIILTAKNANQLYTGGESIINTGPGGWEQIQCRTHIPNTYTEKTAHFYMLYNGKGTAWFDDVRIKVYPCK